MRLVVVGRRLSILLLLSLLLLLLLLLVQTSLLASGLLLLLEFPLRRLLMLLRVALERREDRREAAARHRRRRTVAIPAWNGRGVRRRAVPVSGLAAVLLLLLLLLLSRTARLMRVRLLLVVPSSIRRRIPLSRICLRLLRWFLPLHLDRLLRHRYTLVVVENLVEELLRCATEVVVLRCGEHLFVLRFGRRQANCGTRGNNDAVSVGRFAGNASRRWRAAEWTLDGRRASDNLPAACSAASSCEGLHDRRIAERQRNV